MGALASTPGAPTARRSPSTATAVYSFTDASGLRGAPVNWIGFDNYDEFLFQGLASRDNIAATLRTLRFMVLVTFIQFTLGLVLALLLLGLGGDGWAPRLAPLLPLLAALGLVVSAFLNQPEDPYDYYSSATRAQQEDAHA